MTYGCCYGKKTDSILSLSFEHKALKAVREGIVDPSSLYATQLFSALYGGIIFCMNCILWINGDLFEGLPSTFCCIVYSLFRFIEEWYRNQKKVFLNLFSISQIVCILLLLTGIAHLAFFRIQNFVCTYYRSLSANDITQALGRINYTIILLTGLIVGGIMSFHRYKIGKWIK